MNTTPKAASSKTAKASADERDGAPRSIFFISPIGAIGSDRRKKADQALKYIVEVAFPKPGWEVMRGDGETNPDSITNQIIERIINCDLVVADLTDSNPNVFYELAVAHGYKRPVVHMMEAGQVVPFDLADQRVIHYQLTDPESVHVAQRALPALAMKAIEAPESLKNPLTTHSAFARLADSNGDSGDLLVRAIGELADRIQTIDRRTQRLEYSMRDETDTRGLRSDRERWDRENRSDRARDRESRNEALVEHLASEFQEIGLEAAGRVWGAHIVQIRLSEPIPLELEPKTFLIASSAAALNETTIHVITPIQEYFFDQDGAVRTKARARARG